MLLRKTHIVVLYLQYITDRRMDPVSCGVVTQMQGHDRDSIYMAKNCIYLAAIRDRKLKFQNKIILTDEY